jgi:hypothetical protein
VMTHSQAGHDREDYGRGYSQFDEGRFGHSASRLTKS